MKLKELKSWFVVMAVVCLGASTGPVITSLRSLYDVRLSPTASIPDGAVLVWNAATKTWTNGASSGGSGGLSTAGLVYNTPGSGYSVATVGSGLDVSGGVARSKWSTTSAETNNNPNFGLAAPVFIMPENRPVVTLTTNIYNLDMSLAGNTWWVIQTNTTFQLSFANIPTSTNGWQGPWTFLITNATTSDATASINFAGKGDFLSKTDPIIRATNITTLQFYATAGWIVAFYDGPSLYDGQHALVTFTAVSASTNYAIDLGYTRFQILASANDVNLQYSTNRSPAPGNIENYAKGIIRASGANRRLDLNSSWRLTPGTVTPMTITNNTEAMLEFWCTGSAETNITVRVTYAFVPQLPGTIITNGERGDFLMSQTNFTATPAWFNHKRYTKIYNDFGGSGDTVNNINKFIAGGGTVSGGNTADNTVTNMMFLVCASGTAATDYAIDREGLWEFNFGNGKVYHFQAIVKTPGNLPTGASDYLWNIGFLDENSNADSVDAIAFRVIPSNASGSTKIQTWCRSNSTGNPADTTITVAASTFYTLDIWVNSAASSAEFYINGVAASTSPVSSNIPSGMTRTANLESSARQVAGTNSRSVSVDYWLVEVYYDTNRQ